MAELIYRTLRENIADIIRKRIIYQELEPGQKIVEQDLAKEFKTSRAPIREALRQLENEGLIEYVRNAGCSVKEITLEEMDNNPEMDSWIMKEFFRACGHGILRSCREMEKRRRLLPTRGTRHP